MAAQILDGKAIAGTIKEEIKAEAARWRAEGQPPKLAVILVGDDPASRSYAKAKQKVSTNLGIEFVLYELAATETPAEIQSTVLDLIASLNADESVDGIMVELPLPAGVDKDRIMEAIVWDKDVDGMCPLNRGKIMSGGNGLFPATPLSCIEILVRSGIDPAGKHVVIVGRGETVGKPLVFMLLRYNPTITICHSRTLNLKEHTLRADIIIMAVGRPNLLTADMVRPGAVVVDAGINETAEGLCGDAAFSEVAAVASHISPVPGGVGSLTTALLIQNVLKGKKMRRATGREESKK